MSCISGANIVHAGLVMHVDAANPKSYPGTGTVLTDLSGNGNHMTLGTGTAYAADNNGLFNCDVTVNGNIISDTGPNLTATDYTIIAMSRIRTTSSRTISAKGNNWLMGNWGGSERDYYALGWVNQTGPTSDFLWHMWATTGDISGNSYKAFENGINYTVDTPTGGTAGPNAFRLNQTTSGTENSDGQYINLLAYDRILTDAEILQNFEALRSRVNI